MQQYICPCGSGKRFNDCCSPVILGQRNALTAEELMRSRYSAYATGAVDYIFESTHPSTQKFHPKKDIAVWAKKCEWKKLEIVQSTPDTVTFRAIYTNEKGKLEIHYEHSTFVQEGGKWFFLGGEDPA